VLYRLEGVHVAFAGRSVLRGASLQHNPGERLILLGRNGGGKTTLLRVILGELPPDEGSVERARGLNIARLDQRLVASPGTPALEYCLGAVPRVLEIETELAAAQAAAPGDADQSARLHDLQDEYEHLEGYRARPRAQATLAGLGIGLDMQQRPLELLSGGERTRVALARALLVPAPLLLLDEPTNHLDVVGVAFLAEQLAQRQAGLLLVTHDRDLVDRVGGEVLELHGGRLTRYPAGYERYRRERESRRETQRRAYELQRQEIARQEEFIRRNMAGQNTKQAQSRQKLLDRLPRLEAPEPDQSPFALRWPASGRSGDQVLEVERLAIGFDRPLLRDVALRLRRGERLAVLGRNGAGKTTLLHTLAGRLPALGGSIRYGTGVAPGWYDQEQSDIPGGVPVLEAVLSARPDWTPAEGRTWAGRFGFSGEAADASTDSLSGGERARVALARLIAQAPNLMLLDEPTNHLDLASCEVLEQALSAFPGALVLISHDRRLVERVATGVLLLDGDRAEPLNTVDEAFVRLGLAPQRVVASAEPRGPRRSAVEEERRRIRREAARARETADGLAAQLAVAEESLREAEALLCRPDVFSNPTRAQEVSAQADRSRAAIDDLTQRWLEAEEHAEALERRLAELETQRST
jgi:ATP-binding cassette subfamily F protein 3